MHAMSIQSAAAPAASTAKPRLAYIDNIRWTVIAMVVLVHACVTYSGLGSWYYKEPAVLDLGAKLVFWMYSIFSQAFFMGLLFFVAATFMPASYDRKGFARFVGERAFRLGIPPLVFMLVPGSAYHALRGISGRETSLPWTGRLGTYPGYLASGAFLNASGPLWFAVALLVFSLAYAIVRLIGGALPGQGCSARRRATGHCAAGCSPYRGNPHGNDCPRLVSSPGSRSPLARAGTTCSCASSPSTSCFL